MILRDVIENVMTDVVAKGDELQQKNHGTRLLEHKVIKSSSSKRLNEAMNNRNRKLLIVCLTFPNPSTDLMNFLPLCALRTSHIRFESGLVLFAFSILSIT